MAASADRPRYVYGVVRASRADPKGDGIREEELELVASGDVAALVSAATEEPLEAGRDELLTHARVLEKALEGGVVLPMQFGVILPDAAAVEDVLLAPHETELMAQLDQMDGRVELNVKGIYDEDAVLRDLVERDREIAGLRERIRGSEEEATYPERIRLGELISEALAAKREQDEQTILERLSGYAAATEVNPTLHERMVCNISFLVAEEEVDPFNEALDELGSAYGGDVRFKYTGPLPPHSFVELTLDA
ncbi:GvpL/GvpF family gas vesicle protein [Thermoleophilia bacterium SCSIO 60948]|nr:GvpL/GvpF family gas vesicle protein [Thermoleophilia bacterium SCSIO 60948]